MPFISKTRHTYTTMTSLFIDYLQEVHPHTILRRYKNKELNAAFNIAQRLIQQQVHIVIVDADVVVTACLKDIKEKKTSPVTFTLIRDKIYTYIIDTYITPYPNIHGLVFVCDQNREIRETRSDLSGSMATDPDIFGMMTNSVAHDPIEAWKDMRMRWWNLATIFAPVLKRLTKHARDKGINIVIATTFVLNDFKQNELMPNKWSVDEGISDESMVKSVVCQYRSAISQTVHTIKTFARNSYTEYAATISVHTEDKNMIIALCTEKIQDDEIVVCTKDTITSIRGVNASLGTEKQNTLERIFIVNDYMDKNKDIPRLQSRAVYFVKNSTPTIVDFVKENYNKTIPEQTKDDSDTRFKVNTAIATTLNNSLVDCVYQGRFFWGRFFKRTRIDANNDVVPIEDLDDFDTRIIAELNTYATNTCILKITHIQTIHPEWYDELKARLAEYKDAPSYMSISLLFQHMFVQQQIEKDTCNVNWASDNVDRLMSNKGRRYILPVVPDATKRLYDACQVGKTTDLERMTWDFEKIEKIYPSEYKDDESALFDGTLSSSHDVFEYALPFIKNDARDKLYAILKPKLALFKTIMENSYLSYLLFRREYDLIYRGKPFEFAAENLVKIPESSPVLTEQPLFATFLFAWLHSKNLSVATLQRAQDGLQKLKTAIAESRDMLETVHTTFPSADGLRFAVTPSRIMLLFANWPREAILAYIKRSLVNKENVTELNKGLLFIDKKMTPVVFYDVSFRLDDAQ